MNKLDEILNRFKQATNGIRDKGTLFEELIYLYIQKDPIYVDRFSEVWRWKDFPHTKGSDIGIDLVAKEKNLDGYCAIQCKFHEDIKTKISKAEIDSFLSASGKSIYSTRLIVSTTDSWSNNAEETIQNQQIPVSRIGKIDLLNSAINWDECDFLAQDEDKLVLKDKLTLRPHQIEALKAVTQGLQQEDRGKLIMACGSGKTFTSLKIMENSTKKGDLILFLVPSLSLLDQSLRSWLEQTEDNLVPFVVCSDSKVGKNKNNTKLSYDEEDINMVDLPYPATTSAKNLALQINKIQIDEAYKNSKIVIFSTYQSVEIIQQAQLNYNLKEIDLAICDEAHRTTGYNKTKDAKASHFRIIHHNSNIQVNKRLYMTATPRIYTESAKTKANNNQIDITSMDDETIYGKELYGLSFGKAVEQGLLTDYKVLVFAIGKEHISQYLQNDDNTSALPIEDRGKIVGCYQTILKELIDQHVNSENSFNSKNILKEELSQEIPMKRLIAFMPDIESSRNYASAYDNIDINNSNKYMNVFSNTIETYKANIKNTIHNNSKEVCCNVHHIDGTMNALEKKDLVSWLAEEVEENECKILNNVRCLSEGLDVPSLDGIVFIGSRKSQIDIIQAVGRVMRKSQGKKYGYIIIPIVVAEGVDPEVVLENDKQYDTIWYVAQALRAHDERFDAMINQIALNEDKPDQFRVFGKGIGKKTKEKIEERSQLPLTEIENKIFAKLVEKCGNKQYWAVWAKDIADIAKYHITEIQTILSTHEDAKTEFNKFLQNLHSNINNAVSKDEAIEMLAQHVITKPIFDALFEDSKFTEHNPVSKDLQNVVEKLQKYNIQKESQKLQKFYNSMIQRVKGIDNAEGKQKIIIDLYDNFFKAAFPRMSEKLGIVYTPVEVVDFIIQSVEDVLQQEFQSSLNDKNVNILDPFTGTGTFLVRLLQSGLITTSNLPYKYQNEIFANEIVLLAYYIASINIETTYHGIVQQNQITYINNNSKTEIEENKTNNKQIEKTFLPFEGIILTDTFNLDETQDLSGTESLTSEEFLPENSDRIKKLKSKKIKVIIGNPPYSAGQKSANDNNQNLKYKNLDAAIANSYVKLSKASLTNSMYDSYIKAIKWASNKLKNESQGVIAFVTNGSFLDSTGADGMRKSLEKEFNKIYCFNLRGNLRTAGEKAKKEGTSIFGNATRTPVAITILVKNQSLIKKEETEQKAQIFYYDIGDYLTTKQKLEKIANLKSINNLDFQKIIPNENADWLNQRNNPTYENSNNFITLGDKNIKHKTKDKPNIIFKNYTLGIQTNRDTWVYNYNYNSLCTNVTNMVNCYNSQVAEIYPQIQQQNLKSKTEIEKFINNSINLDKTKISWTDTFKNDLQKNITKQFDAKNIRTSTYRPFCKQKLYFSKDANQRTYQLPNIFPEKRANNLAIGVTGKSAQEFSCFIVNEIPCYDAITKAQWFPMYLYKKQEKQNTLFEPSYQTYEKEDAIVDETLIFVQNKYKNQTITKDSIFYYIYGILHSPQYKEDYEFYITKEIPKIPFVNSYEDFKKFEKAGRELSTLHLMYEEDVYLDEKLVNIEIKEHKNINKEDLYKVKKIKFASKNDKSTIIFNNYITISNIQEDAYKYKVNGKSPVEWLLDRYQVTINKDSLIENNPNFYSEDKKYIFNLLLKLINISIESVKIINNLPKLKVE